MYIYLITHSTVIVTITSVLLLKIIVILAINHNKSCYVSAIVSVKITCTCLVFLATTPASITCSRVL